MKTKLGTDPWENRLFMQACDRERCRRKRHNHGRLTFDCIHTVVKDDRVVCQKGVMLHVFSNDNGVSLLGIMRGWTSHFCRTCIWYEEDK